MFEKALKEAQIEDFRWHDLRHTTASYIAMQGASSAEIAAVLGHKSLSMVKRYSHISEDHSTGILEKMNQSIFGD
jgi:site-specific recombinase XerD